MVVHVNVFCLYYIRTGGKFFSYDFIQHHLQLKWGLALLRHLVQPMQLMALPLKRQTWMHIAERKIKLVSVLLFTFHCLNIFEYYCLCEFFLKLYQPFEFCNMKAKSKVGDISHFIIRAKDVFYTSICTISRGRGIVCHKICQNRENM